MLLRVYFWNGRASWAWVSDGGVVDNTTFWHAMLTKDGALHHEPNPPLLLHALCGTGMSFSPTWYGRYEFPASLCRVPVQYGNPSST